MKFQPLRHEGTKEEYQFKARSQNAEFRSFLFASDYWLLGSGSFFLNYNLVSW
jgi:hypothetical protein